MSSWHRTDNDLLSVANCRLLAQLPGTLGAAALGYLTALRSWCSAHRSLELLPEVSLALGRLLNLTAPKVWKILAALVDVGYLDRSETGHELRDAAVVGPVAPAAAPPTSGASRQRRYKERLRARGGDAKPVTGDAAVTSPVTGERHPGDGGSVTGASPGVSPPPGPPTPAHARVQAQAPGQAGGEPPGPPEGAPSAALPPSGGESKPKAQRAAKPKAKPSRALPARKDLAAAYAAGISAVTGAPCSPPTERWALDDLEAMLATHAPGLVGAEALGWLTRAAKGFAGDKREDRWTVDKGFPPKMARSWLDGGNKPAIDHGPPPPPPGPKVRPGPGPATNWLAGEAGDLFACPDLSPEAAE